MRAGCLAPARAPLARGLPGTLRVAVGAFDAPDDGDDADDARPTDDASAGLAVATAAIFIDKDGTLVENVPYNADPALLRFMPGALEALGALASAGFALVVVTNQSGLAHGYFTRSQFARLQAALEQRLAEAGVRLLDMMVCPHAPGSNGAPACLCRKPAPGMLRTAARKHRLDLARSWMVGDTLDDVEAGRRAGCRSLLLDSGGETLWRHSPLRTPQAHCSAWDQVVQHILTGQQPSTAQQAPPAPASS